MRACSNYRKEGKKNANFGKLAQLNVTKFMGIGRFYSFYRAEELNGIFSHFTIHISLN